jgi:hypothetical protein
MATASRPGSGALSTQFTHAVERYNKTVQDLVRRDIKALNLFKAMNIYKESRLPMAEINPMIESRDVPVTRFTTGYETLPTVAAKGAQAYYIEYSNYAAPVAMSWVEEKKIRDPYQMIDLAKTRLYKAGAQVGETIDQDIYWGTINDAASIFGLEQIIFPKEQRSTATGLANLVGAAPWQFRQADNSTYAGIARAAFTAEDVTGTGFENASVNLIASTAGTNAADFSLATNGGYRAFNHFYDILCYGNEYPDIILSGRAPAEDYERQAAALINIQRSDESAQAANLGFSTRYFKGALWLSYERTNQSGLTNSLASTVLNLYLLNTSFMRMEVDVEGDLALTEWNRNAGQLAAAAQVLFRGQLIVDNPKYFGVAFNYGL